MKTLVVMLFAGGIVSAAAHAETNLDVAWKACIDTADYDPDRDATDDFFYWHTDHQ